MCSTKSMKTQGGYKYFVLLMYFTECNNATKNKRPYKDISVVNVV